MFKYDHDSGRIYDPTDKHTPGPWEYGNHINKMGMQLPLIHMGVDNWAQVYGPEKEYNARLIAAAPDLNQCLVESTILIRDTLTLIDEKSIVAGCLRKQLEFNESTLKKHGG